MRFDSFRPYSVVLLIPLWMAGGIATASGHRSMGVLAIIAMLAIVLDSVASGGRRPWPLRRSIAAAFVMTLSVAGGLTLAGYGVA